MSHDIIAVVGATGAVGREALAILAERGVEPVHVRALASARSAGGVLRMADARIAVLDADAFDWKGVRVALFCADAATSRTLAPRAVRAGATVIDNSSAFRLDPRVPLVVPEVNGDLLDPRPSLIANPNCSAVILLTALQPLRCAFGVRSIHVATYQAVSGAGLPAIESLRDEAAHFHVHGRTARAASSPFREPCAFNVFSHDSDVDARTGLNGEEAKIIDESRRIWNDPALPISPTCVRVPVFRAHTQAITVELARPAREDEIRSAVGRAPGLRIVDDRAGNDFPTPLKASGGDDILVGRIRPDPAEPADASGRHARWCLLASGDQLRKGAALNAVQIALRLGILPGQGCSPSSTNIAPSVMEAEPV